MAQKQSVIVKGQRDGINIMLDENADFEQLQDSLREKVTSAKRFFDGANTNISFKGRNLTETEEQHLLDIIMAETTLGVDFVESEGFIAPPKQKETEVPSSPKQNGQRPSMSSTPHSEIAEQFPEPPSVELPTIKLEPTDISPLKLSHTESETAYYKGGLRSGQSIQFHGSVVIMGDVNPGSEVVAGGNIIVLGSLKGMAHAGSKGDINCFVSALALQPTQLRIGKLITYIPAPKRGEKKQASYAYVKDDQVFIAIL